jgi:hypothetical protein
MDRGDRQSMIEKKNKVDRKERQRRIKKKDKDG